MVGVDFGFGRCLADPFHILAPFTPAALDGGREDTTGSLPDDLADYLVYVTRNALLAGTKTLSRAWTEIYKFFLQLSYLLALERLMRSMMAWQALNPMMQFLPGGQHWTGNQGYFLPAPAETQLLPYRGPKGFPALPTADQRRR